MKKLKLILPLFILLFLLCSCGSLDEMKSQHALDYGNGIIEYDSATYKRIEEDEMGEVGYFSIDRDKDLYITAPDVPVLLSQFQIVKHPPFINADHTIICDSMGDYYILEDRYDEILATIQNEAANEKDKE